jgi:D-beta-D-heptose 7-phosphate kinase/D-beta-D-heptose 1-phosphate adenosyltransferase
MAQEVYDVTGAGDTVIAVLALAHAAGASMPEAAVIANCAAGRAVAHVGTVAPTAEEVRAALIEGARRFPQHSAFQLT